MASILAQEVSRGESLLFLREGPELRQRAQPLLARHAPALEPEPAEDPDPGRPLDEARLRLYLLPESVQGSEGRAPRAPRCGNHLKAPSLKCSSSCPGSQCDACSSCRHCQLHRSSMIRQAMFLPAWSAGYHKPNGRSQPSLVSSPTVSRLERRETVGDVLDLPAVLYQCLASTLVLNPSRQPVVAKSRGRRSCRRTPAAVHGLTGADVPRVRTE